MHIPAMTRPASHQRSTLVCVSPRAGARSRRRTIDQIVAEIRSAGFDARVVEDSDELRGLAAEWHAAGRLRAVAACGGDGTASLVRNLVPLEVPLVCVPLGTENLLGGYLSQPATSAAVRQTLAEGVTIGLDLGVVSSGEHGAGTQSIGEKYFLLMVSAGFDAEVIRRLHERRSGHVTRASYVKPALEAIRSYQYPPLRLYCREDGATEATQIHCRWAFAFNLPLYACGWRVAPQAVGTDALLDVCTFERGSLWQAARYLWHVTWGSHRELSDTRLLRSRRFRLEAIHPEPVAYQLDGDCGGVLPIEVGLLPGELRLLVMPEVASRLGFPIE